MNLPLRPCKKAGCTNLTRTTYCSIHIPRAIKGDRDYALEYSKRNNIYQYLYDSKQWQILRRQQLHSFPLCYDCLQIGIVKEACIVDHIKAHKGNRTLFYDKSNLRSLCTNCHNKKTAKYDGGFGNKMSEGDSWDGEGG
jgi:5-methylcytosine-specific restriction protein A